MNFHATDYDFDLGKLGYFSRPAYRDFVGSKKTWVDRSIIRQTSHYQCPSPKVVNQ